MKMSLAIAGAATEPRLATESVAAITNFLIMFRLLVDWRVLLPPDVSCRIRFRAGRRNRP
jgi:hypothetical protein